MTATTTKIVMDISDVLQLASHVTDTGGFCLCLGQDSAGDVWRLAILPGVEKPYVVQIQHVWKEKGRLCHAWHEWEAFVLLPDAAGLFCHVINT